MDRGLEASTKIAHRTEHKLQTDPYSAWQRGCNENTNGLLRQYFPKGSDLSDLNRSELASALNRLNHRPRKCLGYRLPHEVFTAAIRGALQT